MVNNLEVYTAFNPDNIAEYFSSKGWPVGFVRESEVNLVPVTPGAALECGDGRFDNLQGREANGIRVFGGINAVMAVLTGGDEAGLARATYLIGKFDATPGTHSADGEHGGCGYVGLWMNGVLESAVYPYQLHNKVLPEQAGVGQRLRGIMKELGGKHFRLNGNHIEEAVRLNPFRGYTEKADNAKRFRVDDWFMADLGVPDKLRFHKIEEVTRLLKPDAMKVELIIPNSWYNEIYGVAV